MVVIREQGLSIGTSGPDDNYIECYCNPQLSKKIVHGLANANGHRDRLAIMQNGSIDFSEMIFDVGTYHILCYGFYRQLTNHTSTSYFSVLEQKN